MSYLERFRLRLARPDALLLLAVLGVSSGLLAGAVVVLFRLAIELCQGAFLPGGGPENYEALSWTWRLMLPVTGALLIGALFQCSETRSSQVGVIHVMVRLGYHQGHLPLRNAFMQFAGAALSIISGHSLGREGPGVHLGAASGSVLGQALHLPNNSIRTLVACGTAASIAASFNTPIAGVVFAMEVVMMEYTIAGFTPVILAAVVAAALARSVYGAAPAFDVPALGLASLWELPPIVVLGTILGAVGAAFTRLVAFIDNRCRGRPLWSRTTVAGLLTGLCALVAPQVMGIGYDTLGDSLGGALGLQTLMLIAGFKFLATVICAGLALPGGIIGPTLVIGATAGGALGVIASALFPGASAASGLFAMLGMGAMMSAVLHAPLAALMAIVELTADVNLILPGMLAVVAATLTAKGLLRVDSLFLTMMRERGMEYCNDPVAMALSRISVAASMERNLITARRHLSAAEARALAATQAAWIVVMNEQRAAALLSPTDLDGYLRDRDPGAAIDLLAVPVKRLSMIRLPLQATLLEALQIIRQGDYGAGFVAREQGKEQDQILGVLTRRQLESTYGSLG